MSEPGMDLETLVARMNAARDGEEQIPTEPQPPSVPAGGVMLPPPAEAKEPEQPAVEGFGALVVLGDATSSPEPSAAASSAPVNQETVAAAHAPALPPQFPTGLSAGQAPGSFADEIPVEKADEMGEMLPPEAREFLALIRQVPDVFHDTDALRAIINNVLLDLQEKPFLEEFLQPADVGQMMRAMRESFAVAQIHKKETKGKRGRGASAQKQAEMAKALSNAALTMGQIANFADIED